MVVSLLEPGAREGQSSHRPAVAGDPASAACWYRWPCLCLRRPVAVGCVALRVVRVAARASLLRAGGLVSLPPGARRLDVAEVRRAFAAGTLSTVGDDVAREDGEQYVVPRDANRDDANVMQPVQNRWITTSAIAESVRRDRLARWQVPRV